MILYSETPWIDYIFFSSVHLKRHLFFLYGPLWWTCIRGCANKALSFEIFPLQRWVCQRHVIDCSDFHVWLISFQTLPCKMAITCFAVQAQTPQLVFINVTCEKWMPLERKKRALIGFTLQCCAVLCCAGHSISLPGQFRVIACSRTIEAWLL